jgi:hypothetical protein
MGVGYEVKYVVFLTGLLFLFINCSYIPFLHKKHHNLIRENNDPLQNFFVFNELEYVDDLDNRIPIPDWVPFGYYIVPYDMNNDGKVDMRMYCPHIFSYTDNYSGEWERIWGRWWFRKEVDTNYDGKFDYILIRDEKNGNARVEDYK